MQDLQDVPVNHLRLSACTVVLDCPVVSVGLVTLAHTLRHSDMYVVGRQMLH
jgi:hypothetical protein